MAEFPELHPDLEALVGTVIHERYEIERLLGAGGMGAVFKARHTGLSRDVAIKVLHPEIGRDPSTGKRFEREATSASRLDHPNCVRVTDFGTTPSGVTYLVMELLEGCELGERMGRPWAAKPMVDVAKQVLAGLEHAHHFGIVHRDLKPENVFVTKDFRGEEVVKLVDFGIAKLLDERGSEKLTRQGVVFGTPRYMSPEQAAGGKIDERTDLYAAGLIFYELLNGGPPFVTDEPAQLLRMQIMESPPPLPASVPAELAAVIEKLLEKSKGERYGSAREAIAALEALEPLLGSAAAASGAGAAMGAAAMAVTGAATSQMEPGSVPGTLVLETQPGAQAGGASETAGVSETAGASGGGGSPGHSGVAWQPAAGHESVRSGATISTQSHPALSSSMAQSAGSMSGSGLRTGSHPGYAGQPATGPFESVGYAGYAGQPATGPFESVPVATSSPTSPVVVHQTGGAKAGSNEHTKRGVLLLAVLGAVALVAGLAIYGASHMDGQGDSDEDSAPAGAAVGQDSLGAATSDPSETAQTTQGENEDLAATAAARPAPTTTGPTRTTPTRAPSDSGPRKTTDASDSSSGSGKSDSGKPEADSGDSTTDNTPKITPLVPEPEAKLEPSDERKVEPSGSDSSSPGSEPSGGSEESSTTDPTGAPTETAPDKKEKKSKKKGKKDSTKAEGKGKG